VSTTAPSEDSGHSHAGHGGAGDIPWGWLITAVIIAVAVGGYLLVMARAQNRLGQAWSRVRLASWVTGVSVVAVAFCPPMQDFAHRDAGGHMVQHLLLGMYAPVLLMLGAPVSALLAAVPPPVGRRIGRALHNPVLFVVSHPITAAVLNIGGLYVLYMTPLYAATMHHPVFHVLLQFHFLAAGYLSAWSIAGPDPAPRRPGMAMRLSVLMVAIAAHGYLAKLLYARAPQLPPNNTDTVAALEKAAQWMYYGGEPAELLLAAALFSWWYRQRVRATRMSSAAAVAA
jgi:putative membrane protein